MATIKINYGGTTYSMVKTSSKITTPSVKIDGGWIPCFKGNRFAEVTHGNTIYKLSPLMVNGYRMACGSRPAYNTDAYVTASCNYYIFTPDLMMMKHIIEINWSFSNSSGASVTVSNTNMYAPGKGFDFLFNRDSVGVSLPSNWSNTFTGTVTVKAGNEVLKQQNFSFTLSLTASSFNTDHRSTQKIKIA